MPGIDESLPFTPVSIAVMTVSDTRTPKDDKSGTLLGNMLQEAGHTLADQTIVKDDIDQIQDQINKWVQTSSIDAIITTGGTSCICRSRKGRHRAASSAVGVRLPGGRQYTMLVMWVSSSVK